MLRERSISAANRVVRSRYVLPWLAPATRAPRRMMYDRRYSSFVARALAAPELCEAIAVKGNPPKGYGRGMSERVIEFPWVLGWGMSGRVLDAGSTMNREYVLDAVLPGLERLDIVTLTPERSSFVERSVSYLFADIRALPLKTGYYDAVTCLSTLEHVGMDNTPYGARTRMADDPRAAALSAMEELRRVLRPGGVLYVTVPYGRPEDVGWGRQLDREELEGLISAFRPSRCDVKVFAYEPSGWRASDLDDAASATYADHLREPFTSDGAEGARAVACVRLEAPEGS